MSAQEKQLRNVLGRFATGVCVVASVNSEGKPIGMTINSFASVSLSPSLVLWSIKRDSLCYPLFADAGAYSVSVLAGDQVEISNRYARAGDHLMQKGDYAITERGVPYVKDSLAHFECESWQRYQAGDHDILVASVVEFHNDMHEEPLIFYSGGYRALQLSA